MSLSSKKDEGAPTSRPTPRAIYHEKTATKGGPQGKLRLTLRGESGELIAAKGFKFRLLERHAVNRVTASTCAGPEVTPGVFEFDVDVGEREVMIVHDRYKAEPCQVKVVEGTTVDAEITVRAL